MSRKVPAYIRTDDLVHEGHFDASPWFDQATADEIEALRAIGWRGDYAADDVGWFMQDLDDDVDEVLTAVDEHSLGFEVIVDPDAAEAWVAAARSPILDQVDIKTINAHRLRTGGDPIDESAGWTAKEIRDMASNIRKHGREVNPSRVGWLRGLAIAGLAAVGISGAVAGGRIRRGQD